MSGMAVLKRVCSSGFRAAVRNVPMRRLIGARILSFHCVGTRNSAMNVSPADFRKQMAWLADHCRILSLAEAVHGVDGVAVTFDDGYRDVLLHAAPVLHALSIPATCFVLPGRMGERIQEDWDPDQARLLTWDEARDLESLGVAIGGHTMTHPRLTTLSREEQRREIGECKRVIERELGHSIEAFAYPYGREVDYDAGIVQMVREAGYRYAFSNQYGVHEPGADRLTIRRIWMERCDGLAGFKEKVQGRLDGMALLESPPGLWARRIVHPMPGETRITAALRPVRRWVPGVPGAPKPEAPRIIP